MDGATEELQGDPVTGRAFHINRKDIEDLQKGEESSAVLAVFEPQGERSRDGLKTLQKRACAP